MDKNYWGIHMGEANKYADFAYENKFIAVGWNEIGKNLDGYKKLDKKGFFEKLNPAVTKIYQGKPKNTRSMIIGQMFRFHSLMEIGDIVLIPKTQENKIYIGTIDGDYFYEEKNNSECGYHHRRKVKWLKVISMESISPELRKSMGAMITIFSISNYTQEIESLLGETLEKQGIEDIENFGLESHLEDFIVANWEKLILGKKYLILKEGKELIGQQYITPIGRIDILAKNKNGKEWLVIELKKGKSSDQVVGQILRYIAWIKENEAKQEDKVRGLIITQDQNEKLKYSIKATENIELMNYSVSFKLQKAK